MAEDKIEVIGRNEGMTMSAQLWPNMDVFGQVNIMPRLLSPNQLTEIGRDKSVANARQAERTSEQIRSGLDKNVDMVVGPSLLVRPTPDWDIIRGGFSAPATRIAYSNACRAYFNNWAYDNRLISDAEGHYDFGGLMWLAYRNLIGPDGETAGVIGYDEDRAARLGHHWATFVNVIDPDRVQTPGILAGREREMGIFKGRQLDSHGRWEGLYILKRHPSEGTGGLRDYEFVPRETVTGRPMAWHFFEKTQGGAQRGMTSLVTSLRQVQMLDKFDNAQLGSAILNAIFAMFAKSNAAPETIAQRLTPAPRTGKSPADYRLDFYANSRIRFGEHRIAVLPEGDDLSIESVNRAAQDPTAFVNLFLRRFASATGTTFEQLANNWSDANYSAARAALLDLWRTIIRRRVRFAYIASLIYGAVIEEAIERRRIVLPAGAPPFQDFRAAYTRCTWMGPAMGQIDPEKEANANETNLRLKLTNRDILWAEQGRYYYEGFEQYALEVQEAESLGFELDPPLPGAQEAAADPDKTDEPKPAKKKKGD